MNNIFLILLHNFEWIELRMLKIVIKWMKVWNCLKRAKKSCSRKGVRPFVFWYSWFRLGPTYLIHFVNTEMIFPCMRVHNTTCLMSSHGEIFHCFHLNWNSKPKNYVVEWAVAFLQSSIVCKNSLFENQWTT